MSAIDECYFHQKFGVYLIYILAFRIHATSIGEFLHSLSLFGEYLQYKQSQLLSIINIVKYSIILFVTARQAVVGI